MTTPKRTPFKWHDGHTHLSFGLFAGVVCALLVLRVSNPDNWIAIPEAPVASAVDCAHRSGTPLEGTISVHGMSE